MQNETAEYVKECAQRAVNYDHARHHDAAVYFYLEAARVILNLVDKGVLPPQQKVTAQKYVDRADILNNEYDKAVSTSTKTEHQMNVERADFLLNEALSTDEAGKQREALELYAQAVETCLKCTASATSDAEKLKYRTFAERSLERAEAIKTSLDALPAFPEVPAHELAVSLSREDTSLTPSASKAPVPRQKLPKAAPSLSADETKVLAATSKINGRSYVPFLPHDLNERFAYPIPFTDSDGLLALADKQKKRLKDWMRPDEFMPAPKMIEKIDSGTIKQTVVSDCSFVASLAIAARYERRFGSRLITNIIYPQNKNGEPVFNPCGKYMIKFHINGILRKVVIDDRLPIGQHGELLCSYSQNKNELWVSLLEKAYMKVMGGYDFPGSNSNIDLHALTGWIPERIPIRSKNADLDKIFERLFARFHQGAIT
ncbi:calpain [Aphelenchoides avenae]|nr:calpain [Aphelenchus avenae]